jgi:YesN/AraC family two-component response regulator
LILQWGAPELAATVDGPWSPGIEVIGGAATGVEAIELARSLQPDIVLTDL